MKKLIALFLSLVMLLSMSLTSALALDYVRTLGNEATFETMTEVRANAPTAMQAYNARGTYVPHPALENYPGDTTYVYRSPDMFGRNGAVRINTTMLVYTDASFATKDEAYAYLEGLGLIEKINANRGAIILVTPSSEAGFTAADQKNYYALQTGIFSINAGGTVDGQRVTYVDAAYYGTYGYLYVIGIDGGATFLNDYVVGTLDYVSRISGMLLVNGDMARINKVAGYVPVYLVNASDDIIAKYEEANTIDTYSTIGDKTKTYNHAFPARQVISLNVADVDLAALVDDAYNSLFLKVFRGQEMKQGLYSAGTPYQGYGNDSAPYSLHVRNAMVGTETADGIVELTVVSDEFADIKTPTGEYLQTWYEYIPSEILEGKAADGTIPMILTLHGGGDDPRQYVDGQGYLELAGAERLVLIAPEKSALHTTDANGKAILSQVLPELVRFVLAKYPAIDASRVYVTGYSMGCIASFEALYGDPALFAAAYPQAGIAGVTPNAEQLAMFDNVNVPITVSTSEYDSPKNITPGTLDIGEEFYQVMSACKVMNDLEPLPAADYDKYPLSGYAADIYSKTKLNGEYIKHSWYFVDENDVPMVGLTYVEDMLHCLYPEYANMVWEFCKHYSRDLETGAVIYNPYVR